MKGFILSIAASAIAFVILLNVLPSSILAFKGDNLELALLAGAVGIVNAVIKPIVKMLSFPISLMTLGLAGFVINAGLLLGVAFLADKWANLNFTVSSLLVDSLKLTFRPIWATSKLKFLRVYNRTATFSLVKHGQIKDRSRFD